MGSTFQLRPTWTFKPKIGVPLVSDADFDQKKVSRAVVEFALPMTIFLDTIFDGNLLGAGGRSASDEQAGIFKWMETMYGTAGLDGKKCLLRTICEMQGYPIGEYSMYGELLSILMSPRKDERSMLDDYIRAEKLGRTNHKLCGVEYHKCPFSVFDFFSEESPPDERQSDANQSDANPNLFS